MDTSVPKSKPIIGGCVPSLYAPYRLKSLTRCVTSLHQSLIMPVQVYGTLDGYARSMIPSIELDQYYEVDGLRNVAKARNIAVKMALADKCEYIINIDDDAFVDPTTVVSMAEVLASFSNVGMVIAYGTSPWDRLIERQLTREPNPVACWMVRAREFEALGLFDEELVMMEDKDVAIRYFLNGQECVKYKQAVAHHRRHNQSGCGPTRLRKYPLEYMQQKHSFLKVNKAGAVSYLPNLIKLGHVTKEMELHESRATGQLSTSVRNSHVHVSSRPSASDVGVNEA